MKNTTIMALAFIGGCIWFVLTPSTPTRKNPSTGLTARRKKVLDSIARRYAGFNSIWTATKAATDAGDIDEESLPEVNYFLDAVKPYTDFYPPQNDSTSFSQMVRMYPEKYRRDDA